MPSRNVVFAYLAGGAAMLSATTDATVHGLDHGDLVAAEGLLRRRVRQRRVQNPVWIDVREDVSRPLRVVRAIRQPERSRPVAVGAVLRRLGVRDEGLRGAA